MDMKRFILIVLSCALLLTGLAGCGKQNKVIKEHAQAVAEAFADGDMAAINMLIFGIDELEVDGELSDLWGETVPSHEGMLEHIFRRVSIKVKKATDSTIVYEIKAPDMRNVFTDIDAEDISEDELLEHIKSYAKNAETTSATVSLAYIIVDDAPVVNYRNEAFINAVTGGLLDAYKSLYEEMMADYMEGVQQG